MPIRHMLLAALVSAIWGLAFVAIKIGLESFSPSQLTALRFLIACLPVLFLPRPRIPWSLLVLIGMTLFTGQFLLLFFAYQAGMPAGLASVTQQVQPFFTVALAAIFLGDRPTRRQSVGMALAFCGLAVVGVTIGGDLTLVGLALAIAAAFSWAVGNVLVKRVGHVPMFGLMAWLSLVPPLPALILSALHDPNPSLLDALSHASWRSLAAALYLGAIATALAYALWGRLLGRFSTALVAPFALIMPCVGTFASLLMFGEVFGPLRYAGMALIVAGLAVIVLPGRKAAPPPTPL